MLDPGVVDHAFIIAGLALGLDSTCAAHQHHKQPCFQRRGFARGLRIFHCFSPVGWMKPEVTAVPGMTEHHGTVAYWPACPDWTANSPAGQDVACGASNAFSLGSLMIDIVVMHENEEWLVPLRNAFEERGRTFREWFLHEGVVPFDEVPSQAVYYNRMSASSHTRGHRFAPELTRMALTWLEQHDMKVVNGTGVLHLELCKLSQYSALQKAGLRTPRTHAVVGRRQLLPAAEAFARWPLIVKPNRGGKGLGVMKFESEDGLAEYVNGPDYSEPLDGLWLLQEYIEAATSHITRCEFVGREFVYAVQVSTADGFELCPADVCEVGDSFCPTSDAGQRPRDSRQQSPGFRITERYDDHPVIGQLRDFLHLARIDVAGIEFIENEQGELYVYDVNTNTNYNQQAEEVAGGNVSGMGAIVDYLVGLAEDRQTM
jgi:glutathione synthase/RimK-type ligase-like ATP-grasp enzyme